MTDQYERITDFSPGEKATLIVGLPGPETELCEVVRKNKDETYNVRFQIHGQGPLYETTAYPNQRIINGLFKRKQDK